MVVVDDSRDSKGCRDCGNRRVASYVPGFIFAARIGAGFPAADMKSRFDAEENPANRDDGAIAGMGADERIHFSTSRAPIPYQSRAVPVEDESGNDNAFTHPPKPICIPMLIFSNPSVLRLPHAAGDQ